MPGEHGAAAADQQGQASLEIARAISSAAADAQTVSESIGGVQEAAASNETQATQVRASALQVNAGAHSLQVAIETFLQQAVDLDDVVDENWDPPVTRGARLVSVSEDALQHVGQVSYLAGMKDSAFE